MTRIAAVFPGQGSQSVNMLAALAQEWPEVEQVFAEAAEVLQEDLWRIVRDNPDDLLNQTRYTQPAMLAAGVACWRVWQRAGGPAPVAVAGHSLGEYSALVAAGAVDFAAAVGLVAERARLMQEAVPAGAGGMAAILGLDDDRVAEVCESVDGAGIVEPVNFNAPGQVVIAGNAAAVDAAVEAARAAGAKRAVPLAVSVPSHSSLMRPAAEALAEALGAATVKAPAMPVIHNVDAMAHADADGIRDALRRQLYNPVRWTDSVSALRQEGAELQVELGPGKVLTGLARRIDRGFAAAAVEDPDTLAKAIAAATGEGR